jgi:hypothetical protein
MVEPEEIAITRQRHTKHMSAATDTHATVRSSIFYAVLTDFIKRRPKGELMTAEPEECSNTSITVVGGDEMGTQCLGV